MIYISGALKGSSDLSAARELYERVAGMVEGLGQDAYVPHKATDPEGNPTIQPGEVFRTAVDNILASKGVIAFLNEPSLGVGAEIAICIHESIPVLGLCDSAVGPSRFVVGFLALNGAEFVSYSNWMELEAAVVKFIQGLGQDESLAGAEGWDLVSRRRTPCPLMRFLHGSIRFRLRKSTLASLPPHLRLPPSSCGGHRRARRGPSHTVSTPGAAGRPSRTAANCSRRLL